MKEYKRLIKYSEENQDYITPYCDTANCDGVCVDCDYEQVIINRLAELEDKIENGTLKEIVRCKDCVYFQPAFVEMENKERRPYTEEEIKNGKIVSMEQGINCGSRCERYRYWDNNSIPVWFNENDFCSYGKPKQKLKELKGEV